VQTEQTSSVVIPCAGRPAGGGDRIIVGGDGLRSTQRIACWASSNPSGSRQIRRPGRRNRDARGPDAQRNHNGGESRAPTSSKSFPAPRWAAPARIKLIRDGNSDRLRTVSQCLSMLLRWPKDIGRRYAFLKPFPLHYIQLRQIDAITDKKSEWAPKSFPITVFMCFLRPRIYTRTDGCSGITCT
jgi:hypothetical protein